MTDKQHAALMTIGENAYRSIAELVAAAECDYDRLADLMDERDDWTAENPGGDWAAENPDDAAELAELQTAAGGNTCSDDAEQAITEDPLEVVVRGERIGGEWEATDYRLLITTGGPAVRIVGDIDGDSEPHSARLEVQDWGTPWAEYRPADPEVLLSYARRFYFGDY